MSTDDKHGDHDLKAYLEGRDGVSAAYRKTAQDEPPATLDQLILKAAREQARPSTESWYAARRPYALAASVMIAIVGLSLYLGTLDELVSSADRLQPPAVEAVELRRVERAEAPPRAADEQQPAPAETQVDFAQRQLPAPAPIAGAADAPAPASPPNLVTDALSLATEPPVVVIDGPLLESIEADAAAAAQGAQVANLRGGQLQEITVTGARIRRGTDADLAYRNSRDDWLAEIRTMAAELDERSRLITARRSAEVLQGELEEEIELFLQAYPDTDIDAELEP